MTCDSLQERAGRGLSDDTNHVAVRAHGEATEANKDRRHQNLSAPDILIFNTNFPPPKMYECARLQNVRVREICVKTTSMETVPESQHVSKSCIFPVACLIIVMYVDNNGVRHNCEELFA